MRGFGAPELWQPHRTPLPPHEKPRHHPKMLTGFFMLSPLSRLLHLGKKRRVDDFVPDPGEIIQPSKVSRCGKLNLTGFFRRSNRSIYSYYAGNLMDGRAFWGFVSGVRMPTSRYHRK